MDTLSKWSQKEVDIILENYSIHGFEHTLGLLPNKNNKQLRNRLSRMKIKMNPEVRKRELRAKRDKNPYNNSRVDIPSILKLDSKEACYIMGLIWADGYLINKNGGNANRMILEMKEEDLSLILPIFNIFGKWTVSYRNRDGRKPQMTISISSRLLYRFFENHNYTSKVASTNILEKIPHELRGYWLRGLFDGDGCCYVNKSNRARQVSFSGPYDQDWSFINILREYDIKYSQSQRIQMKKDGKENRSSLVRFCSKKDIKQFANLIYPDLQFDFGLLRKYNKLLEAIED